MKAKFLFTALVCAVCFTSCIKDENDEFGINVSVETSGYGDFAIVNMETNDTLMIQIGGIQVNVNPSRTIVAHSGNTIKMKFEPKEKYKDSIFTTKYTLPNNLVVENQPEYEYVVENVLEGSYDISLDINCPHGYSASEKLTLTINQ